MGLRLLALIFLLCFAVDGEAKSKHKGKAKNVHVPTYSSIVMDAHTGRVLFSEQPDAVTYPASLTKMMTLYLVFEALESGKITIRQKMKVSKRASRQSPSKLYLKPGETITVYDAILALMTKSANDVAVVVGEALGGSEDNFALMMTQKAKKLGMKQTQFKNASGLPNKGQTTSARDMAILSNALYHHYPRYYKHFQTKFFNYKGQSLRNHNGLLGKVEGVDGIKTGFIFASGWNLAASAVRSGQRVIAVVLGGKSRVWRDKRVEELLEYGFKNISNPQKDRARLPATKPVVMKVEKEEQPTYTPPKKAPTMIAAEKPEVRTPSGPKLWAVQVGAFKSLSQAQKTALEVQQKVPSLRKAKISVTQIKRTRGKLFQSRLINLTKEEAEKSCPKVINMGQDCMALKSK